MKKNVTDILDIHTHKQEIDSQGKSIINYPLLTDSPLYMPLAKNAEVAVSRGLLLEEYLGFLNEGEGLVDTLSNNVFSARKGYYYSAGIHPWELAERNADQQLAFLQKQLKHKQFVAVGEAGLDRLTAAPMELQLTMFKKQVQSAGEAVGRVWFAVDYPLRESNGRAVSSEKRISSPTSLDMAWFSWKTGAGGTVVEERVLSFFWGILSR